MTPIHNSKMHPALAGALASFAGAAACGEQALRTHQWLSLGPICGLDRPSLFLLHCPACPAGLALAALGGVLSIWSWKAGALAVRRAPAAIRERR